MSLLPSRDPVAPDGDPRVIAVDSDDADAVLSALSADTARQLLGELHESPAPPGELADRVDTSLQNAQYHLEKLESAGAVEVVDTAYSEKGREMDLYAPANQPLVICAGDEQETSGVRSALTSLLGGLGVVGLAGLLVQQLYGRGLATLLEPTVRQASADQQPPDSSFLLNGSGGTPVQTMDAAGRAATEAGPAMADGGVAAGLPPGLAFFAGGAVVLLGLFAVQYARR